MFLAALNTLIIGQNKTKKEVNKLKTSLKFFFMEARVINLLQMVIFSVRKIIE